MFITGLGTAVPEKRYSQRQCLEALRAAPQFARLAAPSRVLLERVLGSGEGVQTRHLALDALGEAFELDPDVLHRRYFAHAPALATRAARAALDDAGAAPGEIDALLISTCTGYLCPGLTSYVAERLGLRSDTLLLDLVGQGCGAALPNLRTGEALLAAQRCGRVLSVCVEVCSAALYFDDDPGVLISACLFGDGAGAAVLADSANGKRPVKWKANGFLLQPDGRELLRFEHRDGMLRNILTPQVPAVAARHAATVLGQVLGRARVRQSQVKGWVLHPGGRDVLLAVREQLGLTEHDVRWSTAVLHEFGNLSSGSVYFVLQNALADSAPDGFWWMSSFGAGFASHGALLEVG